MFLQRLTRSAHGPQLRLCPRPWTGARVVSTHALPLAERRQVETVEEEAVDGVAEEDLGEGVLAVGRVEELLDGDLGEVEELVAGEARLVVLELLFDPGLIALARCLRRHAHRSNVMRE